MRVLMVNKYLYPRAGAETYMITLSQMLKNAGHEVAFWGMEHSENTTVGQCYTIPLIEFGEHASKSDKVLGLSRVLVDKFFKRQKSHLMDVINTFQPDVIHAHNVYNQIDSDLLCEAALSIPTVMTSHDYHIACPSYNLYTEESPCKRCVKNSVTSCIKHRCVQGSLFKSSLAALSAHLHRKNNTYQKAYRHIIAPSRFMKQVLVDAGIPEKSLSVIHNFISLEPYEQKIGKNILFVGRLSKEKGVETLLKAYAQMGYSRSKLVIAGTGPIENYLKDQAKNLGLRNIDWLGRLTPDEVQQQMDLSACVVVPSEWYENCSMTILEALSRGRPVITCNIGGNAELVSDEVNGVLFSLKDPESLAEKLSQLIGNQDRIEKMSQNARKSVEMYFSGEKHLSEILGLYQSLVNR